MCESCSYEEGDYVIEGNKIFQYDKLITTLKSIDGDEDYTFILKHMKDSNFFPNVWMLSDHGNLHLINMSKKT